LLVLEGLSAVRVSFHFPWPLFNFVDAVVGHPKQTLSFLKSSPPLLDEFPALVPRLDVLTRRPPNFSFALLPAMSFPLCIFSIRVSGAFFFFLVLLVVLFFSFFTVPFCFTTVLGLFPAFFIPMILNSPVSSLPCPPSYF